MNVGMALAGEEGAFAAGPGDADLPADHGFGVVDSWGRWVIVAKSGPASWLKLLFLAGNFPAGE